MINYKRMNCLAVLMSWVAVTNDIATQLQPVTKLNLLITNFVQCGHSSSASILWSHVEMFIFVGLVSSLLIRNFVNSAETEIQERGIISHRLNIYGFWVTCVALWFVFLDRRFFFCWQCGDVLTFVPPQRPVYIFYILRRQMPRRETSQPRVPYSNTVE